MDHEQTIQLIYLYRKHTLLWNIKDHEHYNSKKRLNCWKKIAKELPFAVHVLKNKMRSLLGSYRREKSKERRSREAGNKYVYKSRWYGIEHFEKDLGLGVDAQFVLVDGNDEPDKPANPDLRLSNGKKYSIMPPPHLLRKKRLEKKRTPEKAILDQACEVLQKINAEYDAHTLVKKETIGTRCDARNDEIGPGTRKKSRKEVSTNDMLAQMSTILEKTVNPQDPYHSFGSHIANELRKYDQKTFSQVKYDINCIINDADMGKYDTIKLGHPTSEK